MLGGFLLILGLTTVLSDAYERPALLSSDAYERPALLSSVSYCDATLILNWSCRPCLDDALTDVSPTGFYEFGDIELYTAETPMVDWVVFRGSDSLEDWFFNLDIRLEDANWECSFQMHSGFKEVWDNIFLSMQEIIRGMNHSRPLAFTGHSLGGAMATLAAYNLTQDGRVITFGMPRIGDDDFIKCFDGRRQERYVNRRDVFAHLPPRFLGFRHIPQEFWWENESLWACSAVNGEDMECSDSFPGGTSIEDHKRFAEIEFKCVGRE